NGSLQLTPDGLVGVLDGELTQSVVALTGLASVRVNTTSATVVLGEATLPDLTLPANSFTVELSATLSVGGQALTGTFRFEQAPDEAGARRTVIAVSGISGNAGGVALSEGAGVLLLTDDGAAGFISARATVGGSTVTGIVTINSTGVDIDT